jgi:Family of unknown function (DUF6460)
MQGGNNTTGGGVSRFLGGSPIAALLKLALLCIVVGFILSAVGIDPWHIARSLERMVRQVWNMGFGAIRWLWRYFLLGAVVVIPVWLLVRLMQSR